MSNHQKRMSSPKAYPIDRKDGTYVVKAKGPYPQDDSLPLVVLLRDMLGYADTEKDVTKILHDGNVLINGTPGRDSRVNVGFMDVISIPAMDEHYRLLLRPNGVALVPIDDADRKLSQVADKTTVKGGKTQLNLYGGNNILTDDEYDTRSTLVVSLPDFEIEEEIAFEEGNLAIIRGGKHTGELATIDEIVEEPGLTGRRIVLTNEDGETFETVEKNVFMVGEDGPEVTLDE